MKTFLFVLVTIFGVGTVAVALLMMNDFDIPWLVIIVMFGLVLLFNWIFNNYLKRKRNSNSLITGRSGTGKSHYIKNTLLPKLIKENHSVALFCYKSELNGIELPGGFNVPGYLDVIKSYTIKNFSYVLVNNGEEQLIDQAFKIKKHNLYIIPVESMEKIDLNRLFGKGGLDINPVYIIFDVEPFPMELIETISKYRYTIVAQYKTDLSGDIDFDATYETFYNNGAYSMDIKNSSGARTRNQKKTE